MNFKSFKETIEKTSDIAIFTHVNPDGDTLGSMIALYQTIKNHFQKEATMFVIGKVPDTYEYLPYIDKVVLIDNYTCESSFDLAIAIDVAAKDRLYKTLPLFESAKIKMNIDHHKTNNNFGDVNLVRGDASSAGEVLFDIIEDLQLKPDEETAVALYTAILTDTGGFRFENTNANVLKKAAKLVEYGANPAEISKYCYESKPKPMVLLQANSLINAQFSDDNKIAYVCIKNSDLSKYGASNEHTDGIVEALRQINTVEIAFVLKEVDENTTKVSLRSKVIDISKIAATFGGGGHKFAAGCTIHKPLSIAASKMLDEVKKVL